MAVLEESKKEITTFGGKGSQYKVIIDDRKLMDFWNRLELKNDEAVESCLKGMAKLTKYKIRAVSRSLGHWASGHLARNTKVVRDSALQYRVVSPYYMKFLESGTVPHPIPRHYRTLAWASKHGMSFGTMRKKIKESGTKPHPFVRKTIKAMRLELDREMRRRMELFLASGAKKVQN